MIDMSRYNNLFESHWSFQFIVKSHQKIHELNLADVMINIAIL